MKHENKKTTSIAKPYEPTSDEKAAMQVLRNRRRKAPPRLKFAAEAENGAIQISLDHPNPAHGQALLMRAMGTGEVDFFVELLNQLSQASADGGQVNEQRVNFMVAVIKDVEPTNQVETMLAAQMAAVHMLTMSFASRLANAGDLAWRDSAERTLNKLARTFTTQVETLKRYRSNGQTVRVEHVNVNAGGQAIVGNVSTRGAGATEKIESTS